VVSPVGVIGMREHIVGRDSGLPDRPGLLELRLVSESDLFETTSEAATEGVRVQVRARYSPEHSAPTHSRWFFLYTIRIINEAQRTVQLVNRHWTIVDGTGHTEEVHGPGVVGEQPVLEPGNAFEYTSGCPLPTPFGSMAGTFEMQRDDGTQFDAEVALFQLIQPGAIH
jgi:ApaG protein